MAACELLIEGSPGETRIALAADGRIVALWIDRVRDPSRVGSIFLGRVTRVEAGMDAAFVDCGLAQTGFLRGRDAGGEPITAAVHEGQTVVVQVTRDAEPGKGARLTLRPTLAGRLVVLVPGGAGVSVSHRIDDANERSRLTDSVAPLVGGNAGLVVRTAAAGVAARALYSEAERLQRLWQAIAAAAERKAPPVVLHREPLVHAVLRDHGSDVDRIIVDDRKLHARLAAYAGEGLPGAADAIEFHRGPDPLFARHEIEEQIEGALSPAVALPSGGRLTFETTRAFVAVDVDSARTTAPAPALATNLEAAREIGRQLRLRALAGTIVIDFIAMPAARDRQRLATALRAALAADAEVDRITAVGGAGIVAVTRRKTRRSLAALTLEDCAECTGRGRVRSGEPIACAALRRIVREAAAAPAGTVRVRAAPAVAAAIREASGALDSLAKRLSVESDDARDREEVEISVVRP